ncbi:MAG: cell surface protein, partial [Verrucomicrobiota bacterium]|nr:cell surface protein [Verrucomicrobiota bacterium]
KMEPNLSQALHLLNGDAVHNRVRNGGVVRKLFKEKESPEATIEALYFRCLSRAPTDTEKRKLMEALKETKDDNARVEVLEDIFWAILNSKEFIFNH